MKQKAKLKSWRILNDYGFSQLDGVVYGHPKFEDGTFIRTGTILKLNEMEDGAEAETENTIYELDNKDKEGE